MVNIINYYKRCENGGTNSLQNVSRILASATTTVEKLHQKLNYNSVTLVMFHSYIAI